MVVNKKLNILQRTLVLFSAVMFLSPLVIGIIYGGYLILILIKIPVLITEVIIAFAGIISTIVGGLLLYVGIKK